MYRTLITSSLLSALLLGSAAGQSWSEDFDNGSNDANWSAWWDAFNSVPATGGNPGGFLELDNVNGTQNCQFVELFPDPSTLPQPFSGDWRARGVDSVGVDCEFTTSPVPSQNLAWTLTLVSDPGTPGVDSDDCRLVYFDDLTPIPIDGAGWVSVDWSFDPSSPTLPNGWIVEGPCSQGNWDAAWNAAITDIDWFEIKVDTNYNAFCNFSGWEMGFDNVRITEGIVSLGTNYCGPGFMNSTGLPGVMSGTGSAVVADNNFTITGSDLPDGQFAYMIASRTQGFVANPGGSFGNLCIVGNIARFNRSGEIGAVAGGSFSLLMPLGDFPEPMGSVAVIAGDTWNFQCWHRDFVNGSPTSNFTDGLSLTFQ
jgi:hypothetical protein